MVFIENKETSSFRADSAVTVIACSAASLAPASPCRPGASARNNSMQTVSLQCFSVLSKGYSFFIIGQITEKCMCYIKLVAFFPKFANVGGIVE